MTKLVWHKWQREVYDNLLGKHDSKSCSLSVIDVLLKLIVVQ